LLEFKNPRTQIEEVQEHALRRIFENKIGEVTEI
jgi:hypothetical protein